MTWDLSCPDWAARIQTPGASLLPDLPNLDRRAARKAIDVFDRLQLPDVPGMPRLKDACGEWFREIVGALHGSIDPITGERHIREIFALVPKKHAKTTLGAALMLTSLILNKRPNAEFLLVAPTQPIAELAFRQVEGMIAANAGLTRLMQVQFHLKKVTFLETGATLQVKSFDPSVLTGVKPAGILLDELHVVSSNATADRVVGQLRGGLISQPEGFLIIITTQSERPPAGVFKAELDKARAIRDGRRGGAMLPILYEFPRGVDWRDTSNWWMVSPNLDRSITLDRLISEHQVASDTSVEELARWSSQHLNVEIGLGLITDHWPGARLWAACGDETLALDAILDRSEVVCVGVDDGGLDDFFALGVLGRERGTRRWLYWARAWVMRGVLETRKNQAQTFLDLEAAGDLVLIAQKREARAAAIEIIQAVNSRGLLAKVAFDPWGVRLMVDELAAIGISQESEQVVGVSQGGAMMGVAHSVEAQLVDGNFLHCAQPLMAYCVGNARMKVSGNTILVTKQASSGGKIDALMALFDAAAVMLSEPHAAGQSVYNELGAAQGWRHAGDDDEEPALSGGYTALSSEAPVPWRR